VYGASWLSIRSHRLGIRYHTSINKDRIVIYALSARGVHELATWSVACDEPLRQSTGQPCVFSQTGRSVFYLTESQVRARWFGPVPVDVCLHELTDRDCYWEQLVLKKTELLGLSRNRRTNRFQLTTIPLSGTDAGRAETREVRGDTLDRIDRPGIVGASSGWLYLVDADQPNSATRLEALDVQKDRTHAVTDLGSRPSASATSGPGLLALGTFSGRVHLVDLKTQQRVRELDAGVPAAVGAVSWSLDGDYLAAGLIGKVKGDQLIVYRSPFREKLFSVRVAEFGCEQVALSDTGEWVAGFGSDRIIRVWKVPTER
jgi:hypothetical protein